MTTKFCVVTPNICRAPVRNLLHVTPSFEWAPRLFENIGNYCVSPQRVKGILICEDEGGRSREMASLHEEGDEENHD